MAKRPKLTATASPEGRYLQDIQDHIEKFIGPSDSVLHEIVSPTIHVDIHIVPPTTKIPYLTLMTSGMSDKDMNVPSAAVPKADYELAEIIAFLPPDWPVEEFTSTGDDADENPSGFYPVFWMKHYARKVHEQNIAMSWFNTTANGDPAEPIEDGVGMVGFLFAPPLQLGPGGLFVPTHDNRQIRLLSLVPIWSDEVVYAINKGGESLCDRLDVAENFVFDPSRQSCLKRKKLFGLF